MGLHFTSPRPCRGECLNEPHSPTSQHIVPTIVIVCLVPLISPHMQGGLVRIRSAPLATDLLVRSSTHFCSNPPPHTPRKWAAKNSYKDYKDGLQRRATKRLLKIKLLTKLREKIWQEERYQITHTSIWYLRGTITTGQAKLSKTPSIQTARQFTVVPRTIRFKILFLKYKYFHKFLVFRSILMNNS